MQTALFSPLRLRGLTLRNRIVLAPMLTYQARNGHVTDWHLAHLAKFAVGGAGLVFMESTKVDPRGCTTANDLGLWKDDFIEPLRRITRLLKEHGAAAGIQLGHSGRKARNALPWQGRHPIADLPGVDHGEPWDLIGPSAVPHGPGYAIPRAMTAHDIAGQLDAWAQAARRADLAGFDVLEVHAAHGYLLHQFLSAEANRRDDAYGGSLQNRMRFPLEAVRAARANWPADKPLFCRISAVDEAGWSLEDSHVFVRALLAEGVDVIDCSAGGMTRRSIADPGPQAQLGYQVPYAQSIRGQTGARTMAVGLIIHADQADTILRDGNADLVALGRELLYNPNWPMDAAGKLGVEQAFSMVPPSYGYWLEKRAHAGFARATSTWPRH
ncbi:NADH:flavin oxidoreductase/NADH oxidase [Bordetella petrii]|nr:NADH:flavin oxidoreductase/NADH oxidase [Bordetella petrii]